MPATFETLDAARVLIDYAETACDPATVKVLYALAQGISTDLAATDIRRQGKRGSVVLHIVPGVLP